MPGRGLIVMLVVLLVALSVLSATRDVSRNQLPGSQTGRGADTSSPATTTGSESAPSPPGKAREAETIRVRMPSQKPVRVPLGARVEVTVASARPEIVSVEKLGVRAPVGPGTTGTLDLIAPSTGRFPVTLAVSGRRIGELAVSD